MEISKLSKYFMPEYIEMLIARTGGELWPLQKEAVNKGLLDFKWTSFLASAPHGSGKTLVAELATVRKLQERATARILYLVPYKAMAQEIFENFSFLKDQPYKREIGIWTGDKAIDRAPLLECNFLVMTYELFQLMLLSDLDTVLNVDLVIIDELHFIEEPSRGSRQEAAITRFLTLPEHPPVLALSPIVSNLEALRKWLGCDSFHASTKERKSPLYEGIVNPEKQTIEFYLEGKEHHTEPLPLDKVENKQDTLIESVNEYLQKDDRKTRPQVLIFVAKRAQAREIAHAISQRLKEQIVSENIDLPKEEIKHALGLLNKTRYSSSSTFQNLGKLISTGVAYHHAGLGSVLRRFVEQQFREKRIVVLVSTTTLGVGVNLPASRVYFLETKAGRNPLTPIKYRNMAGRAGRPQFQEKGESIILSTSKFEMISLFDEYISNHEPELRSYLLRISSETEGALLAWISQGISSLSELERIVSRSFNPDGIGSDISRKLNESIEALENYGFITTNDEGKVPRYRCTVLGQSAGTSGARPDDSSFLILNLQPKLLLDDKGEFDSIAALFCICLTSRFDGVYLGRDKTLSSSFNSYMATIDRSSRIIAFSNRWRFQNAFYNATLLHKWITGMSLKDIGETMNLDSSSEELIERLVPNATEMLQYYLVIAEKCGATIIKSNDILIGHLRVLRDCLELGTDTANVELARLFQRKSDGRQLIQQLNNIGISTPNDLLAYPYVDFSEESAKMNRSDFFYAKNRALLLIQDIDERKIRYIQLLARHYEVYDETLEDLLSNPTEFENGVRTVVQTIADKWPDHLECRQVRDNGAGSELPRPESYLHLRNDEESLIFCFEAKTQENGNQIKSHEKSLSVLNKCLGASTHKITVGWPSFHKDLYAIAKDRKVILLDSTTIALIYVWIKTGFLSIGSILSAFNTTGNIQPDAFDFRVPRWWPRTQAY